MKNQGRITAAVLIGFIVIVVLALASLVQAQDVTAPVIKSPGNQTNAEGDVVELKIKASDESPPLTYFAQGLPPGLSINSGTGLITGTLGFDTAGEYASVVTVQDSVGNASQIAFLWTVTDATPPVDDKATAKLVDCSKSSLQEAINGLKSGETLRVLGTCNEDVVIPAALADITLDGQGIAEIVGTGSTPTGPVTVLVKGRNVRIRGFTITRGSAAIDIHEGGTALIESNVIEGSAEGGVEVLKGAYAALLGNTIRNNASFGVLVSEGSSVRIGFLFPGSPIVPNVITGNGSGGGFGGGILVLRSSSARIAGNTISGNTGFGVAVLQSSFAQVSGNTIENNTNDGILVGQNGSVNLGGVSGGASGPNGGTNGNVGINCFSGWSYVTGPRGTLTGSNGPTAFSANCIDSTTP